MKRDDQPAALGLAIRLLTVPGDLSMDEEAGKGGATARKGGIWIRRAGQGQEEEGIEGPNCLSKFLVSFGSHRGVFSRRKCK